MARRTTVVFATSNPHKVREVAAILAAADIDVKSLADVPAPPDGWREPVEDALSFAENARLKAVGYAAQARMPCLAEDSGLEVDALQGAPGVHSARYAGASGDRIDRDRANNEKLLAAMEGKTQRAARFVCAMVLVDVDGAVLAEARGTMEGTIADAPRGSHGFGYDPLLALDDGRTSAELSPEEKNARSHRGEACRQMAARLKARR